MRRTAKITVLAAGALLALGATAYATTGADPGSPIGIVGNAVCSFIHSILH
jgi:hypothetical protein